MKKNYKAQLLILFVVATLMSCSKKNDVTPSGALGSSYPEILNSIVTQQMIDTLVKHGMTINAGRTPPELNGEFEVAPYFCTYDNNGGGGYLLQPYHYGFFHQDNLKSTIVVKYAAFDKSDTGSDSTATYICGNDKLFTVFSLLDGKAGGVTYKALSVFSGTLVPDSIRNFKTAFYMLSKASDPGKIVVPVGTLKICKDFSGDSALLPDYDWGLLYASLQTGLKPTIAPFFSAPAKK